MAGFEEEVRKLRRSVRTVDLEIHISGFSGTHSVLCIFWHSNLHLPFFFFFFLNFYFNMHNKKHFYKNVVFSLCDILVSPVINNTLKHRLRYLKHFRGAVYHSAGVCSQPQSDSWVGLASSSCLKSGKERNIEGDVWLIIVYEENPTKFPVLHFCDMVMGYASSCAITLSLI